VQTGPSLNPTPTEANARITAAIAEKLVDALNELPPEQRKVFVAHELDGRSFKDLAAETHTPLNTLLSRKHAATLHLRRRLKDFHSTAIE
jgi:DNA-directed RNA polymerase specialized sigma24 family protein